MRQLCPLSGPPAKLIQFLQEIVATRVVSAFVCKTIVNLEDALQGTMSEFGFWGKTTNSEDLHVL